MPAIVEEILAERARRVAMSGLETLLCSPRAFGLPASPLQRAIARAADGRPYELSATDAAAYFGGVRPTAPPRTVVVVAGVRSGKSILAGAAALRSALTVPLTGMRGHEVPIVPIVASTVENASATFSLLLGAMRASPVLTDLIVGEPTRDRIVIRRPTDDRLVDIRIVAAHRGGATLRSRWLLSFVLDEVAQFGSLAEGRHVNADEVFRAALPRLPIGGQGWIISSPYGPQGLLYSLWREHFGKSGDCLVVWAPTTAMNTDPMVHQLVEDLRARDLDTAAREYDAQWLEGASTYLPAVHIDAAMRDQPMVRPPEPRHTYVAAIDPAVAGNAWTLVVATLEEDETLSVVRVQQWRGSQAAPLSPAAIFREIAEVVAPYRITQISTDQWGYLTGLKEASEAAGLALRRMTAPSNARTEYFEALRMRLADGRIRLPPDAALRSDLIALQRRASAGGFSVVLPTTADGRHCDYAPALALAVVTPNAPPVAAPVRELDELESRALERYHASREAGDWLTRELGDPADREIW